MLELAKGAGEVDGRGGGWRWRRAVGNVDAVSPGGVARDGGDGDDGKAPWLGLVAGHLADLGIWLGVRMATVTGLYAAQCWFGKHDMR